MYFGALTNPFNLADKVILSLETKIGNNFVRKHKSRFINTENVHDKRKTEIGNKFFV